MSKIFILSTSDLSERAGSTEPYYVIRELGEQHDVHVFARGNPEVSGTKFHKLRYIEAFPSLIWFNFIMLPFYIHLCFEERPDYLYTYKGFNISPWILQTIFNISWVSDFRTAPVNQYNEQTLLQSKNIPAKLLYSKIFEMAYRSTLPSCKYIFVVSESVGKILNEQYRLQQDKIRIVPLGVDTSKFKPRGEYNDQELLSCVYLGSIAPVREPDLCIDALRRARENGCEMKLHFIGNGPDDYMNALKDYSEESGVADLIEWHGYVSHDEVPLVLQNMNIGISPLPAHEMYEVSSPTKVYEYLAVGLPVICSDITPHRQILEDDVTGFFYAPDSAQSLAEQFCHIDNMPMDNLQKYSDRARKESLKHDWNNRMNTIINIFE